jgi:signal transduction histidine kinase
MYSHLSKIARLGTQKINDPELSDVIKTTNFLALAATFLVVLLGLGFYEEPCLLFIYSLGGFYYLIFILLNYLGYHKISRFTFSIIALSSITIMNGITSNEAYFAIKLAGVSTIILPVLLFSSKERKLASASFVINLLIFSFFDKLVEIIPIYKSLNFDFNKPEIIIGNGLYSMIIIFISVRYYKFEKEYFRSKIITKHEELKKANEKLNLMNQKLEKKVAERTLELKLTNDHLTETNKKLKELLHKNSHELRHDTANILGLLSLLNLEPTPEEYQEIIELLNKSAKKLDVNLHNTNQIISSIKKAEKEN